MDAEPRRRSEESVSAASSAQTRAEMAAKMLQRKSILELAEDSGLFSINPSDLVCEMHASGVSYYDYVLSCSAAGPSKTDGCCLYLAKFDSKVNLESFESVRVPGTVFDEGLPDSDLSLMTLGVLTWKHKIAKSRLLCLVRSYEGDCTASLEALKTAASKFRCLHHVQAYVRRDSNSSTRSSDSGHSGRSGQSEAMRMRILLCQEKDVLEEVPYSAIRDTKMLLNPTGNMLACVCFHLPGWLNMS